LRYKDAMKNNSTSVATQGTMPRRIKAGHQKIITIIVMFSTIFLE